MSNTIKAEYYPNKQQWLFKLGNNSEPFITYLVEDVPVEIMDFFAKKHNVIQSSINDLEPDQKEKVIEWFQKVFSTKEFGEHMIRWIHAELTNMSEQEVEERMKDYSNKPITVDDQQIGEQSVETTIDTQKVESVLRTLDLPTLKEVMAGVLGDENWAINLLAKSGINYHPTLKPVIKLLGTKLAMELVGKQEDFLEEVEVTNPKVKPKRQPQKVVKPVEEKEVAVPEEEEQIHRVVQPRQQMGYLPNPTEDEMEHEKMRLSYMNPQQLMTRLTRITKVNKLYAFVLALRDKVDTIAQAKNDMFARLQEDGIPRQTILDLPKFVRLNNEVEAYVRVLGEAKNKLMGMGYQASKKTADEMKVLKDLVDQGDLREIEKFIMRGESELCEFLKDLLESSSMREVEKYISRASKTAKLDLQYLTPMEQRAYTCVMSKGEKVCRAEFGDPVINKIVDQMTVPANKKIADGDLVDKIMRYEGGEMSDEETIALFQELYNSGLWKQLQGHYGRVMMSLIEQGYINTGKLEKKTESSIEKTAMRSIGKWNIKKLKAIVQKEIEKYKMPWGNYELNYQQAEDNIIEQIPAEWFDLWEGAYNEIHNLIDDEFTAFAHRGASKKTAGITGEPLYQWESNPEKEASKKKAKSETNITTKDLYDRRPSPSNIFSLDYFGKKPKEKKTDYDVKENNLVGAYRCYKCRNVFYIDKKSGEFPEREKCPTCGEPALLMEKYIESSKKTEDIQPGVEMEDLKKLVKNVKKYYSLDVGGTTYDIPDQDVQRVYQDLYFYDITEKEFFQTWGKKLTGMEWGDDSFDENGRFNDALQAIETYVFYTPDGGEVVWDFYGNDDTEGALDVSQSSDQADDLHQLLQNPPTDVDTMLETLGVEGRREMASKKTADEHYSGWDIVAEEMPNGDIKFIAKSKELGNDLYDVFEPLIANGWTWIPPEAIGALTDAPIITDDATIEDDGSYTVGDHVYAYMDYQVLDPVEELKEHGYVIFQRYDVGKKDVHPNLRMNPLPNSFKGTKKIHYRVAKKPAPNKLEEEKKRPHVEGVNQWEYKHPYYSIYTDEQGNLKFGIMIEFYDSGMDRWVEENPGKDPDDYDVYEVQLEDMDNDNWDGVFWGTEAECEEVAEYIINNIATTDDWFDRASEYGLGTYHDPERKNYPNRNASYMSTWKKNASGVSGQAWVEGAFGWADFFLNDDVQNIMIKYDDDEERYVALSDWLKEHFQELIPDDQLKIKEINWDEPELDGSDIEEVIEYWNKEFAKKHKESKKISDDWAGTILQQLGGQHFIAMTGASNFVKNDAKQEIYFKIGRNANSINYVKIRLTSMDLYDMEFIRMRAGQMTVVSQADGIYNDQLQEIFTQHTGMYTSLGAKKNADAPTGPDTDINITDANFVKQMAELRQLATAKGLTVVGPYTDLEGQTIFISIQDATGKREDIVVDEEDLKIDHVAWETIENWKTASKKEAGHSTHEIPVEEGLKVLENPNVDVMSATNKDYFSNRNLWKNNVIKVEKYDDRYIWIFHLKDGGWVEVEEWIKEDYGSKKEAKTEAPTLHRMQSQRFTVQCPECNAEWEEIIEHEQEPPTITTCPNCGAEVQTDFSTFKYFGQKEQRCKECGEVKKNIDNKGLCYECWKKLTDQGKKDLASQLKTADVKCPYCGANENQDYLGGTPEEAHFQCAKCHKDYLLPHHEVGLEEVENGELNPEHFEIPIGANKKKADEGMQDDIKDCAICGYHGDAFECYKCHDYVCEEHFNFETNECDACALEEIENEE